MMELDGERRRETRYLTCVPAGVLSPDKAHLALIRDASATGALLLSSSHLEVEDRVTLGIVTDPSGQPSVELTAQVVRVEPIADGIWSCRAAVELVPHRPDLVPFFRNLEAAWKARSE